MKDKIVNDILSLSSGEQFTISEYFKKYGISDKSVCFELCFSIIQKLENNIEPATKTDGRNIPVVGLPQSIRYIKK